MQLTEILPSNPLRRDPLPSLLGHKGGGTDRVSIHPGAMELFDVVESVSVSREAIRELSSSGIAFATSRGPRTLKVHLEPGGDI